MKKICLFLLVLVAIFMTGCGGNDLNFGKELVKVDGMTKILVELESKTSDVGVMDSIMAGYYINEEYAPVGVSSYKIRENDVYTFKLEKFE